MPEAFQSAEQTMPVEAAIQGVIYHPALLASAQVRFLDRKYGVDSEITRAALVAAPERRGAVRWDDYSYSGPSLEKLQTVPAASARFGSLDAPLNNAKLMTGLQKDFTDWVYRSTSLKARANLALKVYAGPDVTQAEFMKACADTARAGRDAEIAKKSAQLDRQIKTLQDKLARENRELRQDETEYNQRKVEEMGTHAENIVSFVTGSRSTRRVSSSLTKRRLTEQSKADVDESVESIEQFKKQLAALQEQRGQIEADINARWGDAVNQITEITINPKKTDIYVNLFGVAWMPYYLVRAGEETFELPAFGAE